MKRVEPAPTIRPMMYAIRILVIWLFLSGLVICFSIRLFRLFANHLNVFWFAPKWSVALFLT
jgi:hypothetical protein